MSDQNDIFHTVHEKLRHQVWNKMYENGLISRYYEALLKKHKRRETVLRSLTVAAVLLTVGCSLLDLATWSKLLPVTLFLGLYLTEAKVNFAQVDTLTRIRDGSSIVGRMLENLWTNIETGGLEENMVRIRLSQINETELALVSRYILDAKLAEDRELNIKCAEESKQTMINFYHGASA